MTEIEIKRLISVNQPETLNLFLSSIIEKSKNIDKQLNLISLGMLILILIYYLGEVHTQTEIQIGPIKISDTSVLLFVLPLILSFLTLQFLILSSHKAELKKIIQVFAKEYFFYDNTIDDILYTDDLTRIILPVSLSDEINKFNFKTKVGCLSVILMFPMFFVAITPYLFIAIWTYPQLVQFSSLQYFNKTLVVITIWIILLSIFYFIKTMVVGSKEN